MGQTSPYTTGQENTTLARPSLRAHSIMVLSIAQKRKRHFEVKSVNGSLLSSHQYSSHSEFSCPVRRWRVLARLVRSTIQFGGEWLCFGCAVGLLGYALLIYVPRCRAYRRVLGICRLRRRVMLLCWRRTIRTASWGR